MQMSDARIEVLKKEVANLRRQQLKTPGLRNELNAKIADKLELVRRLSAGLDGVK
jgi:hypothetical protein